MTWWEQWAFNLLHAVVAMTGVAYLYMKYAMPATDPFAVINHPWQPATLSLHVVAAPVFIAFFGMLFRSHTLRKLASPNPANRRTGWTSLISFSTMALTGYLLQWRQTRRGCRGWSGPMCRPASSSSPPTGCTWSSAGA